jgi:ankyrin repeat protein
MLIHLAVAVVPLVLLQDSWAGSAATDSRGLDLRIAAREGRMNDLERLLNLGVSPNATGTYGETALQYAARYNRVAVIRKLLAEGADPNLSDRDGNTPLIEASMGCGVRSAAALVKYGALVNTDASDQRTALIWAVEGGCEPIVKLLLKQKGLNLDHRDSMGRSALDYALKEAQTEVGGPYSRIARALKERGAQSFEWLEPIAPPSPAPQAVIAP